MRYIAPFVFFVSFILSLSIIFYSVFYAVMHFVVIIIILFFYFGLTTRIRFLGCPFLSLLLSS